MSTTRRTLLTGTGALSAFGAALRAPRAQPSPPRRAGTLRVSVSQRVTTLNPLKHINNPDYMAGELLYAGLAALTPEMRAVPDLAERWEANAEATVWTFTLREGLFFHHGPPVTAADVVATFRAVLDPPTASPGLRNVGPIRGVEAHDARTVVFTLSGPFADFPVNVAQFNARIVPAAVLQRGISALDNEAFGCGPFRLARYEPGRVLRVEHYDRYHKPGRPYLDAVEQLLYPDLAGETAALINGEVDIISQVQAPDFARLSRTPGVVALRQPSGRYYNFVLRMDQKPFDDLRVRRALQLCVDRQAMVDLVLEGLGRVAHDNPISPEYRFHKEFKSPDRDPRAARRLLAEASHAQGVRVPLMCANRPPARTQMGVALKEMAREGGFEIDVQTVPYDAYIANVWRKAGFYIGTFNMQPHEDAMLTLLFTSDAPWADSAWNSTAFDGAVYGARRTLDEGRRRELYADAQRLMTTELPYLIPFYEDLLTARRTYVNGYTVHPRGGIFLLHEVSLAEGAPRRG
jgi:peptide/nickel transport system substrate-binding protein